MLEQATIFFHLPVGEPDIYSIPKTKIEVSIYSVDVAEVKIDQVVVDDFSVNVKRAKELREIEIRRAANNIINEHPELKEKLDVGDLLHISGYWFGWNCKWNDGWVMLSDGFVPSNYQQAVQIRATEEKTKEEVNMDRKTDWYVDHFRVTFYCYIQALMNEDRYGSKHGSRKDSDVFRENVLGGICRFFGGWTVKEIQELAFDVVKQYSMENGMRFDNVVDVLRENGIDLTAEVIEYEEAKQKEKGNGDKFVLEY